MDMMLRDVYFLTRLSMLGVVGDLVPKISLEESLEELCERNCYGTTYLRGSHILVCDIDDLST